MYPTPEFVLAYLAKAERHKVVALIRSYDCTREDLHTLSDEQLKDHLYDHQFGDGADKG